MIPFSPPHIDQRVIDEVNAALKSGWITTGPRTKKLEKELATYCGAKTVLCLNSATAGLEIMLRWFGVGPGDEVIVPAYTYSATANVVEHCGAKVVFSDVNIEDFNINTNCLRKLITSKTKVIMPVDFAGLPANYRTINNLVNENSIKSIFRPENEVQQMLGRILVLSDAAHSVGATCGKQKTGSLTDVSVFSFHAVKNLTTAEGGAVALNLPEPFNNEDIYKSLCIKTLHGQNKDALAKMQKGNWKYDIIEPGYKCNMTDIMAAIGLVELSRYETEILPRRKAICQLYDHLLEKDSRIELPVQNDEERESSYHLYAIRIKDISESQRDEIIKCIFDQDVSVNVHFIPVPMMTYYKNQGYEIKNYPITYYNFSREITLPVYEDLTDDQVKTIASALINALNQVMN
jgi:dTDP-4-amino-4,6-dideoxygalactose transaminase